MAGSGDTAETRHHIEVNFQDQTSAALFVENRAPNILWIGEEIQLRAGLDAA